jgi:hypothetical protein
LYSRTRRRTPDDDFGILSFFYYNIFDTQLGKWLHWFGEFQQQAVLDSSQAVVWMARKNAARLRAKTCLTSNAGL